jgi:protein SCO1/2
VADPAAPVPAPDPFRPPASAPADPFRPPAATPARTDTAPLGSVAVGHAPETPVGRSGRIGRLAGAVILGALTVIVVALFAVVLTAAKPLAAPTQAPVTAVLLSANDPAAKPAPEINLLDQHGQPFALSSLRGYPTLVFFGYTHCPDVCPATVGVVDEALSKVAPGPRVVFVTIDPDRDDVAAMANYVKYLPKAYTGLTGTPGQIRTTADAWGVQYAKQQDQSGSYAMAHTADIFLLDAQGRIRTRFPFGTQAPTMEAALTALLAETPAPAVTPEPIAQASSAPAASASAGATAPTAPPSVAAGDQLAPLVVSSEVWAGGPDPVILNVYDAKGQMLDGTVPLDVTITGANNAVAAPTVRAVAVQPWGEKTVYYVATVTIPSPGGWQLHVTSPTGATGEVAITAQDQGSTAPLGGSAPNIHTPTLDDVGGVVRAVTTQPQPDMRLIQTSTSDARAAGRPYVIVIDSARFRVSPLCGKALVMVRYLIDRWQDSVDFISLEPFIYTIITDEPVLSGDISNPPLNQWASAFGLGPQPWDAGTVPWAFVVDGQGVVRAKYQGIIGSADIDVIISLIENNGVIASN